MTLQELLEMTPSFQTFKVGMTNELVVFEGISKESLRGTAFFKSHGGWKVKRIAVSENKQDLLIVI